MRHELVFSPSLFLHLLCMRRDVAKRNAIMTAIFNGFSDPDLKASEVVIVLQILGDMVAVFCACECD